MIATMSATISPSAMCGSAERFTKLGPRKCTRAALAHRRFHVNTELAFRRFDRVIDLARRHIETFGDDQEVMNQRVHVRLHRFAIGQARLSARQPSPARASIATAPACTILCDSFISRMRTM